MKLRRVVSLAVVFCLGCGIAAVAADRDKLTPNQRLIVAAFDLDVELLKSLLKDGADPNARFGDAEHDFFQDKWTSGTPLPADRWTPLLAVANSHREPQPERLVGNTSAARDAAIKQRNAIDPKFIAERNERRTAIAKLLIAARADLDLDDGYGSTALDGATSNGYIAVALLLIESGAKIDTKTGVYIDGPSGVTPLHHAAWHPAILNAMLKKGAKVNVQTSSGDTPLHYAVIANQPESVQSLLKAGADPFVKNKDGRSPDYWCKSFGSDPEPGQGAKMQIAKMLADAKAKK
jgi:hypothetical protein